MVEPPKLPPSWRIWGFRGDTWQIIADDLTSDQADEFISRPSTSPEKHD